MNTLLLIFEDGTVKQTYNTSTDEHVDSVAEGILDVIRYTPNVGFEYLDSIGDWHSVEQES